MLEKIISSSKTFLFSLCFAGNALLSTVGNCASLEEDRKVMEVYLPQCNGEVSDLSLSQLEQQLAEGYTKINRGKNGEILPTPSLSAKVTLKMEEEKGFQQPSLIFYDLGKLLEKAYVINIDEVRGMLLKNENGDLSSQVWFSYSEPIGDNLPAFKRSYFVLEAKEEWKGAAEALCNLSRYYRREKIEEENKKDAVSETAPENSEKESPLHPYLTKTEQQYICKEGNLPEKKVTLLATLTFENCKYVPEESTTGLEELNRKIRALLPLQEKVILACGNATVLSAERCSPKNVEYNNFQLSFDRANASAIYLESTFQEQIKQGHLTVNVYPNSTRLNERSVEIFLIEENK
ncbi:MAG: hypothetical protein WCV90_00745 [Candidatus Woesearchaeota archaeon]|jgi:hypothetical protein